MIIDGLSWHQFSNLPHIASLPLNRQLIEYEIYNQNLIHEVMLIQQQQQLLYPNVPSSAGSATPVNEVTEDPLPSNCIQFVVSTVEDTYFEVEIDSSAAVNYTVDWGDGTIENDVIDTNLYVSHTYEEQPQDYTVRICFDDPSLITQMNFPGFD